MLTFTIADTPIVWRKGEYTPKLGQFSPKFLTDAPGGADAIRFTGRVCALDALSAAPVLKYDPYYRIVSHENQRYYLYNAPFCKDCFAVPYDRLDPKEETVFLFSERNLRQDWLSFDWFLGVSGLHKLFLERQIGIFHACYIDIGGEAVLFAGPSGTGKSTQGQLWAKYAGTEIINGDRVAIRLKNGRYHAYGYPACGSSGICVNRTLPIRAIIALEQGPENRVHAMTAGEKFRALLAGLTINTWEADETRQAMDLAEKWINSIPMYRFSCRPDVDAVYVLETFLQV